MLGRPGSSFPSLHLPLIAALCFAAFASCTLAAFPQGRKHESPLRTVHGTVFDGDENPVPSAVVYLKNLKTQAVTTHIADDNGVYRFSGLDPNVDYEIYAEHGDQVSAHRTLSSFDSRKDIEVILKLGKKKGGK